MLEVNLKNLVVNDSIIVTLIDNYVITRNKYSLCNCGNAAKPCHDSLRTCIRTNAPEGGVYTKLDRSKETLDLMGIPVTVTDVMLDTISTELEFHYDLMNTKIEELRVWILEHPTDSSIPVRIKNLEILKLFYDELCFMIF